ncbi:hypothetical protein HN51_041510 [Arachis hypogaea]
MNLKNEYTWQALKLQVRSDETIINEKYDPFEIIYRIYYKITKVNYDFKVLRQSSKEETIIMHANLKRSNIQTLRRLRHEELKSRMSEEWVIPDGIEEPQIQNTRIREIIREGPDIRIRINRSQSLRISDNVETISYRNFIDNSSIGNMNNILGIDNRRPHIATVVYKLPSEFDPIESQVLSVIIKEEPFEIDKEWIRQDFNADYNKLLRDWYFTNHSENEVIRLRELFYDFMKENRISLYFFDWYVNYYSKPDKKICPLTKSTVVWKTSSGSVIESEYPPKETIKIPIEKDLEVEATSYKDSNAEENIEKRDIKKLHQQLNFTNTILKSKVEAKVEELKEKLRSISLEKLTINTLQKEEELELNKISHKRDYPKTINYYSRPSPVDVGLEERTQLVQHSFIGSDLVEWNIDGLSKQTILD